MKKLLFAAFVLLHTIQLFGQKDVLIIKHVGEQDRSIRPLLVSDYIAGNEISDYLKAHKWSNPRATDTLIVDSSFFRKLETEWDAIVPDEERNFTGLYGSFVVLRIKNDSVITKLELNHRDQSLLFFYKLSAVVKKFNEFNSKSELLDRLRERICRMYFEDEGCEPPPNNMK